MEHSAIKYRKTFLDQVIIRIDFHETILHNDDIFTTEFERTILDSYPKREKDRIIRFNSVNVVIDTKNQGELNTKNETFDGIQKEYLSIDGKNKVIISNQFIVFEINQYSSFGEHLECIRRILSAFFMKNKVTTARTGIRYINLYKSDEIKLQKNFFSAEVAASLIPRKNVDSTPDELVLVRSMNLSEYLLDSGTRLNFRYGMYNPDYPTALKKNDFALDFDCFSNDSFSGSDDILRCIVEGHDAIQILFEQSITETLRKVMGYE